MGSERRKYPRLKCVNSIELHAHGDEAPIWGKASDLSLGGCFIETASNLTAGTRLELTINIENAEIRAIGVVRNRKRNGVGIEFTELTHETKEHLKVLTSERAKFVQPLILTRIDATSGCPTFSRKRKVGTFNDD